jgi:hypothetical protein|tara:strand:- start:7023 stop:7259 length:237 start_codon:yes stop_codon:yes gene_type:complete
MNDNELLLNLIVNPFKVKRNKIKKIDTNNLDKIYNLLRIQYPNYDISLNTYNDIINLIEKYLIHLEIKNTINDIIEKI